MNFAVLALSLALSAAQPSDVDVIPDFSRVGYKYGDVEIPTLPVKVTITEKSLKKGIRTYGDTTAYIQAMIDKVGRSGGGAVLLSNGVYNTSRILFIDYDNTVLRGESREGTVIRGCGTIQIPAIALGKTLPYSEGKGIVDVSGRSVRISKLLSAGKGGAQSFGKSYLITYHPSATSRSSDSRNAANVIEDHVPCGRLYVRVDKPGKFKVGQTVLIHRPHNNDWISAIGMDKIASNGREKVKSPTIQWNTRNYAMNWERVITAIDGDKLFFDAPVVMALDAEYGGGQIVPCKTDRISGSGVETLTVDSTYDPEDMKGDDYTDEAHTWNAVDITSAEHCWVKSVTSHHMGYALVDLRANAKNITVEDCASLEPVSIITGARRYAFCITKGELCLIRNCSVDNDRHGFITNGNVSGPNVYTNCTGTHMRSSAGPHQAWSNGCLYDLVKIDGQFEAQDRGNYGTGHGWAGANFVLWNCTATSYSVQSPWVTAKNYVVGCIGKKLVGRDHTRDYYGGRQPDYYYDKLGLGPNGENRPDGEWYPERAYNSTGGENVSLPCPDNGKPWWPVLTMKSYSNPLSLYECQLEDRHARGIYLAK